MLFYWKWAAALIVVFLVMVMIQQARTGRKLAAHGPGAKIINDRLLLDHRTLAKVVMCLGANAVLAIEFMAHGLGANPNSVNSALYWINASSGVAWYVLFFAIFFRFNGKNYPRLHRRFVYVSAALFLITLATGVPMLVTLSL